MARLALTESSVKVRTGGPVDEPDDIGLPIWAGVIPVHTSYGTPVPAADLPRGITEAASVRSLTLTGADRDRPQ